MPKLIKNAAAEDYIWQVLEDNNAKSDVNLGNGHYLIPLSDWLAADYSGQQVGILLQCDTDPELLTEAVAKAPAIAIHFGAFADGRGFSLARILREECEYTGELQAAGHYIQDQLFYLKRCGFDAYIVDESSNIESMLVSLEDFSNSYQASSDESRPLFRRR